MNRNIQSVYVMWWRIMIRMIRAKGRLLGTMVQPLFFMVAFGLGLRGVGGSQLNFILPGIIAMSAIMSSVMAGIGVIWDREFGFLKEVLVAPVSRVSVIIGRAAGAITTTIVQSIWLGFIAIIMGAEIQLAGVIPALIFLILTSTLAVGIGLSFGSIIDDFENFQIVQNIIIMPMTFLSTAFISVEFAPSWLALIVKLNPFSYGIDGMRHFLTGAGSFNPALDLLVISVCAALSIIASAWFFERIEI
ncbi:MAG: ABC transporter permease [Candidatus Altiarchaeota archaeon]|nr:ABC transporter permease [Candidatus Altiarchaeota archaeon]